MTYYTVGMEAHHHAWLTAHPNRTEDWLRERLRDGFDIHHLDGDHGNNDPLNLVLIDAADHMMLHNGKSRMVRRPDLASMDRKNEKMLRDVGAVAVDERESFGTSWREIGKLTGVTAGTAKKWHDEYKRLNP